MVVFPKPYADAVARLRVPSGFLIVIGLRLVFPSHADVDASGLPLSCSASRCAPGRPGAWQRTGNSPPEGRMLTCGIRCTSAPAGSGRPGGGLAQLRLAVFFAAVFPLVYLPVIQNEEQHLRKIFPEYAGVCGAGSRADSAPHSIPQKYFESFPREAVSNEPRVSSRPWIHGRDAVSLLENAGLRACTHGASLIRVCPLVFVVRMRLGHGGAILPRVRRSVVHAGARSRR